jgi:predicted glycoside hydrolase/deacetylase ChbG (UPF0249 family)
MIKHVICGLFVLILNLLNLLASQEKSLAESLGYSKDARVVIINADDFGMCHAENLGTQKVLEYGIVTSSTLMMPCPWALEAIDYIKAHQLTNIGVHATLTSEWKYYRWRPLTADNSHSLADSQGYMWAETEGVEWYAQIAEVKRELRAQLEMAASAGLTLSHFDSHMGSLYGLQTGRLELLAVALSHAYEFGLPFRLPYMERFKPFREIGFAILDNLVLGQGIPSDPEARKQYFIKLFKELKPGVTEIYIHPAVYDAELARITNSAKVRQAEVDIFTDPEIKAVIAQCQIQSISYEPLKEWQRVQMKWRPNLHAEDVFETYLQILKQSLPQFSSHK